MSLVKRLAAAWTEDDVAGSLSYSERQQAARFFINAIADELDAEAERVKGGGSSGTPYSGIANWLRSEAAHPSQETRES